MQSGRSQLFESLKAYLNNSRRLQPIIGLDSITECVTTGAMNKEPLYFCRVCVCRCPKSDIRNHIFGSHHRFRYIKACHPHLLMAWPEDIDLSAMAWPLMELAKVVEAKEGPGQAQLIEVREALYQKMETLSETEAVTLTILLRCDRAEVVSCVDTSAASHCLGQSQRIILQNQESSSEKSLQDDPPSHQTSCDGSQYTGNPDDYTRTKPLIGLLYVVEYRSEGGSSNCFLCHCCRIRSNKEDVTDHLTSSRHLINYLMETRPEQVEELSADRETLQSLAQKVGKNDCRGDLKVVNVPESLCSLLAANSYHCCLKILRGEWTHAKIPEKNDTLKGLGGTETSGRFTPQRDAPKRSRRKTKKMKSGTETMFTVSLPLSGGPLLLERTLFTEKKTSASSGSPTADLDPVHFPESGSFTRNDDRDDHDSNTSSSPSHFQHDEGEDADGRIPKENLIITLLQDVNNSSGEDYNHRELGTETNEHEAHEGTNNNLTASLETSSGKFYTECQNEYDLCYWPNYSRWEEAEEHCYTPSLTFKPETNIPQLGEYADMSFSVAQHYDQQQQQQQQLCYQHTTGCAAALPAEVPHGSSHGLYDPVPHLNAATAHMQGPLQTFQGFDGYRA